MEPCRFFRSSPSVSLRHRRIYCRSQDRYYVVALRLEYLDQFFSGSLLSIVCVKYFRSVLRSEIRSLTALLSEIDQVTISGPLCLLFERSIDCCNSRN